MNPKIEALFERVKNDDALRALLAKHAGLFKSATYHDYEAALRSNLAYIERVVPEVLGGGLQILDVGPGMGAFMALAEFCGNVVHGIDTAHMTPQVTAYRDVARHMGLVVSYSGFEKRISDQPPTGRYQSDEFRSNIIHFRGSLDAVLKLHFRNDIHGAARRLLDWCAEALKPGGSLVVSHNADKVTEEIVYVFGRSHPTMKVVTNNAALSRLVKA